MKIDSIITLDDNSEYLVLDIVELNQKKYLYCVQIEQDELPTDNYIYLEEVIKGNEIFVKEIEDEKLLKTLISMFTLNYLEQTNKEQAEGE